MSVKFWYTTYVTVDMTTAIRDAVGAARRADDEGQVLLVVAGRQPGGIDAARQVVRDGELECDGPAGVLEVVAMEVDRGVLLRRLAPVGPAAAEVVSGDAARRQVDETAVAGVAGGVPDVVRRDVEPEVPGTDEVAAEAVEVIRGGLQRANLRFGERAGEDARTIDAAVEVEAGPAVGDPGAGEPQLAREATPGLRARPTPPRSTGRRATREPAAARRARAPAFESDRDEAPLPPPERGTCEDALALDDQLELAGVVAGPARRRRCSRSPAVRLRAASAGRTPRT